MNYFKLFDIPVQFKVDKALLRKKYFELSKQSHPDYFVNTTTDEQQSALESSALLNNAFKTLSNFDETVKYVLKEKGLLADEEKYNLPSQFLMQMMDINEALEEIELNVSIEVTENITAQVEALQKEIYDPVKDLIEGYSEGVTHEKELLQVKEYYFKKKYLQRLASGLNQKL